MRVYTMHSVADLTCLWRVPRLSEAEGNPSLTARDRHGNHTHVLAILHQAPLTVGHYGYIWGTRRRGQSGVLGLGYYGEGRQCECGRWGVMRNDRILLFLCLYSV